MARVEKAEKTDRIHESIMPAPNVKEDNSIRELMDEYRSKRGKTLVERHQEVVDGKSKKVEKWNRYCRNNVFG